MKISKLEMFKGDVKSTITFSGKTTILNVASNQYGKSTIVYSILYCIGLGEDIFKNMKTRPTTIKLFIGEDVIIRSKTIWTINNKQIKNSKQLSENFAKIFPNARLASAFSPMKVAELMEYTTLIQKRENKTNTVVWPGMIKSREDDIKRFISGSSFDDYIKLSEELNSIKKHNKKIAMSAKLENYLTSDTVKELKDFEDYEESISKLNAEASLAQRKFRKNRKVITNFESESEFLKYTESFVDGLEDLEVLKDLTDKSQIRKYVKKEFNAKTQKSVSLSEYEIAQAENRSLLMDISEAKLQISEFEEKAFQRIETNDLKSKIISYSIARASKEEKVDSSVLTKKLGSLKKTFEQKRISNENKDRALLKKSGIELADSGVGEIALFLISSMRISKVTSIPIIIDSADEVFSGSKGISGNEMKKILEIIGDSELQIILTTTNVNYPEKENLEVKNIKAKILEVSFDE